MSTRRTMSSAKKVTKPRKPTAKKKERNWVDALMIANRKGPGTLEERAARMSPVHRDAMIAELREMSAKREPLSPEAEKQLKYRLMVAAVRDWLAADGHAASYTGADRIDICIYDDMGGGESVAWFHASADSPYVLGDLLALEPAD